MTAFLDLTLSSYRFAGDHPTLRRDRIGIPEERSPTYDERYDFSTLFYDVFYDERVAEIRLICPMLVNFEPLIRTATFTVDGLPARIVGIDGLSRGHLVRLASPSSRPSTLAFSHPEFSGEVPVGRRHADLFAGRNAVYAISKDNRLEWITDWLTYYVREHGLQAVVLYDNNSIAYSMEDLGAALTSVEGLEAAALVRAWFPFGPGGAGNTNFNSKFLHMTMVELGRQRFLSDARAVLNVDIDEFVYSRSSRSVFDATADSPEGYLRFNGRWVWAKPPFEDGFPRHVDHRFIRQDGKPKVPRKWAIVPDGPLRDRLWRTHRIKSLKDPATDEFGFWHFRQISTNWDYNREDDWDAAQMVEDDTLTATLARAFSGAPSSAAKPEGHRLVITAMKNEAPYLLEWIAYHLVIGFDRFLVYTNDCEDGTDLLLDRLDTLGIVTHVRNKVLKRGPQKSALKYAREHALSAEAGWIYVADCDEFLNIHVGDGTLDDLFACVPDADVIPVTWKLFSHGGTDAYEDRPVIESFTDGQEDIAAGGAPDRFVKSLFRPDPAIERFGTHAPVLPGEAEGALAWQMPDGRRLTNADNLTRPHQDFAYSVAQINHYAVRSAESYLIKKDRGRVNHWRQVMGLEYWQRMNLGGQEDRSIHRHLPALKVEIARLRQDTEVARLHDTGVHWHKERIAALKEVPDYARLYVAITTGAPMPDQAAAARTGLRQSLAEMRQMLDHLPPEEADAARPHLDAFEATLPDESPEGA
ncbi:MAG: glycosyltransferase family 2 protein [Pseudomonadota bacterium]